MIKPSFLDACGASEAVKILSPKSIASRHKCMHLRKKYSAKLISFNNYLTIFMVIKEQI